MRVGDGAGWASRLPTGLVRLSVVRMARSSTSLTRGGFVTRHAAGLARWNTDVCKGRLARQLALAARQLDHESETALDEAAWDSFSRGSPIGRAGRSGFARNVCVALGNWGSPAAVAVLTRALSDPEPMVRAHAAWALGEIPSPASLAALRAARAAECDPFVLEELTGALA